VARTALRVRRATGHRVRDFVVAELVPAIQAFFAWFQDVDARDERGYDDSTKSRSALIRVFRQGSWLSPNVRKGWIADVIAAFLGT